ncbi:MULTISPECIES: restriction endonuclease subunit S [Gammaproteobacteria]|uniref:restriction endonuclease subunit S n=1 Tax=Gammaproteobacteria TaxID=1236 RepID=UPI0022E09A32|nr:MULTISPECIES: restriction endonuclease subunit S [Gammaproteobacteria]MDD9307901.1 restriction endonuclease subunit S [Aeromonas hydrophila]WKS81242.1 restriction endonuclease subunit S [Edwardsiella tarda]HDX8587370.1 restriction endonuclease subunit S [Aeromonas dhakensis]
MTEQQLPEGWQIVKFGDIAKHISKRVEPSETDLEIYVGLEHLDPDSLKIKRHGVPSDVEGQKLLVKKGQIIFGKRRAYQRKVAVADWDCICSAHAMVLEANPKHVIPEFLPFFMQSDVFMNRAVAISEGSLSPTIKWKVLAEQKFLFPNLEQQPRLLTLLKRAERALRSSESIVKQLLETKTATAYSLMLEGNWYRELFGQDRASIPEGWKLLTVGDVLNDTQYGLSDSLEAHGSYPVLRMMNITNGYVDPNDLKYLDWPKEEADKYILNYGDIVFNRTNSMEWVGRTGIFELDGDYLFASYLIRLVANEKKLTPYYLTQYLNLPLIQYRLKAYATPGVSQVNINPGSLKSLPILVPPLKRVKEIEKVLREFDNELNVAKKHHQRMLQFMESIKSKYFEQVA